MQVQGITTLKLDERSSYPNTFACQFGRFRYKRLSFGTAPGGDMFERKTCNIFKNLPSVFRTVDDILVIGYDSDGETQDDTW